MKLYTYDPAPNPQRLGHFMRYKGIEINTEQVDLMAKQQLEPEYLAKVPEATVPALVLDDGTVLTEVIGICAYLEELYPSKPLLGTGALEKSQVLSWDHRLFSKLLMAIAEILRNTSPGFTRRALPGTLEVEQIPELAERGRYRLAHAWVEMDRELKGRTWLAGDHFSLADIDMAVCHGFSGWVKAKPPEDLTHLHDYLARVNAELA